MFPQLPSIGKDSSNRLIISPLNNDFTFPSTFSPVADRNKIEDSNKKMKRIKTKTNKNKNSMNNIVKLNQKKLD